MNVNASTQNNVVLTCASHSVKGFAAAAKNDGVVVSVCHPVFALRVRFFAGDLLLREATKAQSLHVKSYVSEPATSFRCDGAPSLSPRLLSSWKRAADSCMAQS